MTFREPKHDVFVGRGGQSGRLIIVRGCPGSGKSTLAKSLRNFYGDLVHVEADMYFERDCGGYQFNPEKLVHAHRWCQDTTKIMLNTTGKVVVSNTFTRFSEMSDYVKFAFDNNFILDIYTCTNEFQNQHGVPEEKLLGMRNRFQSHEDIMKTICGLYHEQYLQY